MLKIEKLFKETTLQINDNVVAEVKEKKLTYRVTAPFKEITKEQNCIFPATEALNFENHLVAVLDAME